MVGYPKELTVTQAAKVLNVDASTVRRYVTTGRLPARDAATDGSLHHDWRLRLADVEAMRGEYAIQTDDMEQRGPRARSPLSTYQPKLLKGK